MKKAISLILVLASSFLLADSVEDRVNELEKRVSKLEQALRTTLDKQDSQARVNALCEKAKSRMREDLKTYSTEDFQAIEALYQSAVQDIKAPESIESLKTIIAKYPKSNRSGCAAIYLGQMSTEDEQIKYLQQAINEFSNCYYLDGVQVGAYARFILSRVYLLRGENDNSSKLINELKVDFPDAVNHKGIRLLSIISREPESAK